MTTLFYDLLFIWVGTRFLAVFALSQDFAIYTLLAILYRYRLWNYNKMATAKWHMN
jgi:hypothetical protein